MMDSKYWPRGQEKACVLASYGGLLSVCGRCEMVGGWKGWVIVDGVTVVAGRLGVRTMGGGAMSHVGGACGGGCLEGVVAGLGGSVIEGGVVGARGAGFLGVVMDFGVSAVGPVGGAIWDGVSDWEVEAGVDGFGLWNALYQHAFSDSVKVRWEKA